MSDARTVPTAVWFSAASNVVAESNEGAALASVAPLPDGDQPLVPSAFVARTCTSYSVFSASPAIVALNTVIVVFVTSTHAPCGELVRYW